MKLRFFAADREWILERPAGGYNRPSGTGFTDRHDTLVFLSAIREDLSAMRRLRAFLEDPWVWGRGQGRTDREILVDLAETLMQGTLLLQRGGVIRLRPILGRASEAVAEREATWQEAEAAPEPEIVQESMLIDEPSAAILAAANRQWHAEGQALQAHCSDGNCKVCDAQLKVLMD